MDLNIKKITPKWYNWSHVKAVFQTKIKQRPTTNSIVTDIHPLAKGFVQHRITP
jgi:hypothetical protein